MSEFIEQEEGEEEKFDFEAAERQESMRLEGVAKEIDATASFPMLFGIGLITSLFNRPTKHEEKPAEKPRAERSER